MFPAGIRFLPFDLPFANGHIRIEGGEIAFPHGMCIDALRSIVGVGDAVQSASKGQSQIGRRTRGLPSNHGRDGRERVLFLIVAIVGVFSVAVDVGGIGEERIVGGDVRFGGAVAGARKTFRAFSKEFALPQRRRAHGR